MSGMEKVTDKKTNEYFNTQLHFNISTCAAIFPINTLIVHDSKNNQSVKQTDSITILLTTASTLHW